MTSLELEGYQSGREFDCSIGDVTGRIDPGMVEAAPLQRGLALWRSLAGDRLFPGRSQMSPRALGGLLRNTILIKVLDEGAEFQVRIIGDVIRAIDPDAWQGLTTREMDARLPGHGANLRAVYGHACTHKAPLAFRGLFRRKADGWTFHREHLLLPLGESDDAVDHLISLIVIIQPDI